MLLERMSRELRLPVGYIQGLTRSAAYHYKTFRIPKHGRGTRVIHHPSKQVKALQRWLLTNIMTSFPVHPAAMAYRRGVSIFDNARVHETSRYLLRMDFFNFFPSITSSDIDAYIKTKPDIFHGWDQADCELFRRILSRNDKLTIGAPTSPAMSNAICYELDERLATLAAKQDCRFSRYADDLFFSTTEKNVLGRLELDVNVCLSRLTLPVKLRLNKSKTRHSSKKGARKITGITLGSDGRLYIGRQLKRRIRAMVHSFQDLDYGDRATLAGLVSYAVGFDRPFLNALILKYGLPRVKEVRTHPLFAAPSAS